MQDNRLAKIESDIRGFVRRVCDCEILYNAGD
jgi:hypothetical protein